MAEKKTSRTRAKPKKAEVSKAESVDDIPVEPTDEIIETVEQADSPDPVEDQEDTPEPEVADDVGDKDKTAPDDPEPVAADALPDLAPEDVTPQTVVEKRGGFVPMLLGGIVAAGLGYGAAFYGLGSDGDTAEFEQAISDQMAAQSEQIGSLSAAVENVPAPADLTGVEAAQQDVAAGLASLAARMEAIEAQVGAFDARLTDVEKRPLTEGASDAAIAAYERELKALQDAMAAQRAEIEAMASEAQSMEASAAETATATMRRAALTRIQTALDTGTGFAPALADLEIAGVTAPAVLADVAESGVPSLAKLQDDFPEAARAALAVSRRDAAATGEGGGGFSAFLKNQLGARSLEPREGDEPDAVLSRAEAAAREGRLTDALAEVEALPESGRAEMADWIAQATIRLDAVAAAETLGSELN